MKIDLDRLRIAAPHLHAALSKHLGYVTGVREVADFSSINPPATQFALAQWTMNEEMTHVVRQTVGAMGSAAPVVEETQLVMSDILREEQAALQRASDEVRGLSRLQQF